MPAVDGSPTVNMAAALFHETRYRASNTLSFRAFAWVLTSSSLFLRFRERKTEREREISFVPLRVPD